MTSRRAAEMTKIIISIIYMREVKNTNVNTTPIASSASLFTWREGAPANRATLEGLTSHTFL